MKILLIGHGRHGKDTVAEYIKKFTDVNFSSSSMAAAKIFIYDELKNKYKYTTFEECYNDRANHRAEWYDLICGYNKHDKARLAKKIMRDNDIYVGMRDKDEINKCKEDGVFDFVLGVFDPRKPLEPSNSFNIDVFSDSDFVIINNEGLIELKNKVELFCKILN